MSASSPRRKKTEPPEGPERVPARESARAWERAAARRAAKDGDAATTTRRVRPGRETPRPRKPDAAAAEAARPCEDRAAAKPIHYIVQNLERAYGVPVNKWTHWEPLDMLVATILSQATSDVNSERTFDALKRRFPTWDAVLRARESTLADTIRAGGLANQKARVIRDVLRQLKERTGALTLESLRAAPVEESAAFLSSFRGVGPKTVACTLLFACGSEVFPLDTHIFRVLRRVGLVPRKCSDARAHQIMNALVPAGKFYSFHVNLIRHGRRLCRPRDPLCADCPVVEYCDYGQTMI
jgi:endonuclease III